jgi:hypothetical protein
MRAGCLALAFGKGGADTEGEDRYRRKKHCFHCLVLLVSDPIVLGAIVFFVGKNLTFASNHLTESIFECIR